MQIPESMPSPALIAACAMAGQQQAEDDSATCSICLKLHTVLLSMINMQGSSDQVMDMSEQVLAD